MASTHRNRGLTDIELGDDKEGCQRKVEELAVLASFLACATGRTGREPRVDFFLVRLSNPLALWVYSLWYHL